MNFEFREDGLAYRVNLHMIGSTLEYSQGAFDEACGFLGPWGASVYVRDDKGSMISARKGGPDYRSSSELCSQHFEARSTRVSESDYQSPWYAVASLFHGMPIDSPSWKSYKLRFRVIVVAPHAHDIVFIVESDWREVPQFVKDQWTSGSQKKAQQKNGTH